MKFSCFQSETVFPIPDNCKICGEFIAPPDKIISSPKISDFSFASRKFETAIPTAVESLNRILSVIVLSITVKLGLSSAGHDLELLWFK